MIAGTEIQSLTLTEAKKRRRFARVTPLDSREQRRPQDFSRRGGV